MANTATTQRNGKAVKRLLKDWKEIQEDPFNLIEVHLNENDLFHWHIILSPPASNGNTLAKHAFSGIKFHLRMIFTDDYPTEPPKIYASTYIPHPNVFDSYICLDLLQKHNTDKNRQRARQIDEGSFFGEKYTGGWSSAYTAFSILMQLQSFLFDEMVPQDRISYTKHYENKLHPTEILRAKNEAGQFICPICFYNLPKPRTFPPAPIRWAPYYGGSKITDLPQEVICLIFDNVPAHKDIFALRRTCKLFAQVINKYHVITRKELVCFYTRKMFTEAILGVGIYVEMHPDGYAIKNITSPFDLLSQEAFEEDQVRESVWGQPFQYWMPLLLNGQHGRKANSLIQKSIASICNGSLKNVPEFHPLMVLELFPKLMNNMIVNLVKEDSKMAALKMSERTLKGYCSFHHILLHFATKYPVIQERADYWLSEFMRHPSRRVKMVTPDLGELLVLLCLSSKHTWETIAEAYLAECFDRNVLWILDQRSGARPELAYLECYPISEYRMKETFQATIVSRRLLMFQVAFLKLVGRPQGKTTPEILDDYRSSYGLPCQEAVDILHRTCKEIFKVDEWGQFYAMLELHSPSAQEITSNLREAVQRSQEKGYHINRNYPEHLLEMRKEVDAEFCVKGTRHQPEPEKPDPYFAYKVPLSNLSFKVQTADIRELARQFGRVVFVEIQQRGFGGVYYEDRESAETAFKYLDGYFMFGRPVRTKEPYQVRTPRSTQGRWRD